MKRLIVNADDFGLTSSISNGILESVKNGIVTSLSFIVNTDAFEYSLELLKINPEIDVGVHLVWVGEDRPVLNDVKTLMRNSRYYRKWYEFSPRILAGKIDTYEVEKESRAQIEKLIKNGINLTHIDSHQHLHLLPGLSEIVIKLAKEYGVKYIRCPRNDSRSLSPFNYLSARFKKKLLAENLPLPPLFFGFSCSGRLTLGYLKKVLEKLGEGANELMVHPGQSDKVTHQRYRWGYRWEDELKALTSIDAKKLLMENGVKLTTFKEI